MTHTSAKILFFGNERLVSGLAHTDAPVLNGLIKRGYDIRAIISHYSNSKSRNNRALEVAQIGKEHNIPVLLPSRPLDILDDLVAFDAEVAILVAYGRIIPQHVIDLFPKGIINIHPSLLPKYRGPTPIESAILNGDKETGVSIMQLSAGMDSGPVFGQTQLRLHGTEDKFDVYNQLSTIGAELLFELLPSILNGTMQAKPQTEAEATYCKLLEKQDAWLDPTSLTAVEAERRIRAFLGFPKSKIPLLGHIVIITKAHVVSQKDSTLTLSCKNNTFLAIDELVAPSGRRMDAKAFLQGYAA